MTEISRHQGSLLCRGESDDQSLSLLLDVLSVAHTIHLALTVWEIQVEVAAIPVSLPI